MAINTIEELLKHLSSLENPNYERGSYDKFLKSQNFVFNIPSIHITGTNGKGSTANFIRNIYKNHGYKVGLYQSPYFYRQHEMISIDGEEISDNDFLRIFKKYESDFEKFKLTAFEVETFIAFAYFIENEIDICIVEVGMGGTIDATNILSKSILSVITTVSLEHTSYLGKTVSEIATNKAGIISENSQVLLGNLDEESTNAVINVARKRNAKVNKINEFHNLIHFDSGIKFTYLPYHDLELNTKAEYQVKNACIAIEVTKILSDKFPVDEDDVRSALKTKLLINRFEFVKENVLVDGGHNPQAIDNLLSSISSINSKKITVVFACFRDKNFDSMISMIGRDAENVILTTFDHARARTEDEYFLYLDGKISFEEDYKVAIDRAISENPENLIVITGSLAFASVARKYLVK